MACCLVNRSHYGVWNRQLSLFYHLVAGLAERIQAQPPKVVHIVMDDLLLFFRQIVHGDFNHLFRADQLSHDVNLLSCPTWHAKELVAAKIGR